MRRPGQMRLSNQHGIAQGVGIVAVLAIGLVGLSIVYFVAKQEVYADSGSIDFSKLPKTNQPINAPINAS